METTVLLRTITKIGALMKVGFGEAGASVIAKNLAASSGGRLNLMGPGEMIHSIFRFCDVRQFTDTTECLQEEVMLFVNRIAHILHSIVVQCSGSANKNIGDAFLLTWKLDVWKTCAKAALADQALLAFCRSLVELPRHQEFICNFSMAATARLYLRFPTYRVRIGCGLHVGWAIEGAIGSHRKIDASYLSPHVNFTEYLESSTKQYGIPMLLSEPFYRLLSPEAGRHCRQVDRYDLPEYDRCMWETDAELVEMRGHVTEQFAALWATAVQAYIEGDWGRSHTLLTETLALSNQQDGPSHFLLDQIDQQGGMAPADWQGYRNDF
ncbi:nucleotide cyclase [Ochromonadaceae sp. CCMP2298]|nr:nucleotide cyclase [Ochromonadaceae sp. CCMP2298]